MANPPEAAKTAATGSAKAVESGAVKAPESGPAKGPPGEAKTAPPGGGKIAEAAKAAPAKAAPTKTGKKRRWLLPAVLLVVILLGAGGAAAWYLSAHGDGAASASAKAQGKKAAVEVKGKAAKPKPGVFIALDSFTVNLQPDPGEQYLQTTLSLKVEDGEATEAVKRLMPEIRNRILMLLSSKKSSELTTTPGKQALANGIASEVNQALNAAAGKPAAPAKVVVASAGGAPQADAAAPALIEGPVMSVFFTQFIIQ